MFIIRHFRGKHQWEVKIAKWRRIWYDARDKTDRGGASRSIIMCNRMNKAKGENL